MNYIQIFKSLSLHKMTSKTLLYHLANSHYDAPLKKRIKHTKADKIKINMESDLTAFKSTSRRLSESENTFLAMRKESINKFNKLHKNHHKFYNAAMCIKGRII